MLTRKHLHTLSPPPPPPPFSCLLCFPLKEGSSPGRKPKPIHYLPGLHVCWLQPLIGQGCWRQTAGGYSDGRSKHVSALVFAVRSSTGAAFRESLFFGGIFFCGVNIQWNKLYKILEKCSSKPKIDAKYRSKQSLPEHIFKLNSCV